MAYKTCVSIAEKTPKKLKQTLAKALKKSDYAEIRFDFFSAFARVFFSFFGVFSAILTHVLYVIFISRSAGSIRSNQKGFKKMC